MTKKINVHIFLRKPRTFENHSLEKIFKTLTNIKDDRLKFKFVICPFVSSGLFKRLLNCIWAFFNQGDINHITGDVNFISIFLNKNKTINTFHDCYNLRKYSGLKKKLFKLLWFYLPMIKSKYITTVSEFTKKELNSLVSSRKKIVVIPNFLPDFNFKLNSSIKRDKVLIIGTTENKNLNRMLDAIKYLKEKIVIIGKINKEQKDFLKKRKIIFKNYVNLSDTKLVKIYNEGKLLLFPSLYEGFGLPIIEAQRFKIPVVTSNLSPMKDIVNKTALLVDPKNSKDIERKILMILNNKILRRDIIKKGFKNSLRFEPNLSRLKYFNLYKKTFDDNVIV